MKTDTAFLMIYKSMVKWCLFYINKELVSVLRLTKSSKSENCYGIKQNRQYRQNLYINFWRHLVIYMEK